MPELPEVETIRKSLEHLILGKTITYVTLLYPKLAILETEHSLNNALCGKKITAIERVGKYLIFNVQDINLMIHLRMEGRFYLKDQHLPFEKHEHMILHFSDETTLRYHDTRKFGTATLKTPSELKTSPPLNKLGPEPSDKSLTSQYLLAKCQSRRAIKTLLLDQSIIAGLGNIYVDEVLFCATINPQTQANTLNIKQCERIIEYSKKVISKATLLGGSSIRTYTNSQGISGRFQNELNVHLRHHLPCNICNTPIIKTKVNGRGTYYCPKCQS